MNFPSKIADRLPVGHGLAQRISFFTGPDHATSFIPHAPVCPGTAATLPARLSAARLSSRVGTCLAGALAFDKTADDCLWQVSRLAQSVARLEQSDAVTDYRVTAKPHAADYARMVSQALQELEAGTLQKVVLARTLDIESMTPIVMEAVMARLANDPSVVTFCVPLPRRAGAKTPRWLVGATPELLLRKRGTAIVSHPLAGSAPRVHGEDGQAVHLARSEKDLREHGYVTQHILDTLAPYCSQLSAPDRPEICQTHSMWHLGTRIVGCLRDPDIPAVVLAAALHPTPAVCGSPPTEAANLIRTLEPFSRDFYAGAVGWCDEHGDGDWHVAIRCAEICGNRARLYAGAGIVRGSTPETEAAETGAKFSAMLGALGLPAEAGLTGIPQTSGKRVSLPKIPAYAAPTSLRSEIRAPWQLDPSRAALLVHDMQRYFVTPYAQDAAPLTTVVQNIASLLQVARAAKVPVFYTAQTGNQFRNDRGLQADLWGPGMSATPEHQEILPALAPRTEDHVLVKHRYSAFQRSNLETLMRARGRDQLIITGIYAHIGCLATAAEAFQLDIQPFAVMDAQADFSAEEHASAMEWIATTCGVPLTTDATLKILEA